MGSCFSGCGRRPLSDNESEPSTSGHMGVDYFARDKVDVSNYLCQELAHTTVVKESGKLNGQAFHIEGCKDTKIYLIDHTASVTVDLCTDCQIFIGPCKGSLFIRECKRCIVMASCQQFRARDSSQCIYYLHCTTQPVIENCSDLRFGCFNCHYPQLRDHLKAANLSPFNNNWYSIHDFTPQPNNWLIIKPGDESPHVVGTDETQAISFHESNGPVPFTTGTNYHDEDSEICVVVLLNDVENERALKFIQCLGTKLSLLVTKDVKMKRNGLQQFFMDNSATPIDIKDSQVEYLLLKGEDCLSMCSELLRSNSSNDHYNSYCSPDSSQASLDYQRLCHLINSGIMSN